MPAIEVAAVSPTEAFLTASLALQVQVATASTTASIPGLPGGEEPYNLDHLEEVPTASAARILGL